VLKPRWLFRTVRACSRFVPAVIIFNVVVVWAHWPTVVNAAITHHWFHFFVHVVVFGAAILAWLPVLSPLPEIPRLSSIGRIVFLFTQSIVPTVPASFLTFGTTPLYRSYEHLPHLFGLTVLNDQLIAGLIMKIGAGTLLWACNAVIWFKWATREERTARPGWQNLDGDLQKMGMTHR
jgi:putative membrane protein